jgi:uncharacterized surface protein with fasciclin (FAS1) repeats
MNLRSKKIFIEAIICALLLQIFGAFNSQQTTRNPPANALAQADNTAPVSPEPVSRATANAKNVFDLIDNNPSLKSLAAAMDDANLDKVLDRGGPYTIFAPSDRAFAALPAATRERLRKDENRVLLRQILDYHVVPKKLTASQLQSGKVLTQGGNTINVRVDDRVRVNAAKAIEQDLQAGNGVVHIVDRILIPPNIEL